MSNYSPLNSDLLNSLDPIVDESGTVNSVVINSAPIGGSESLLVVAPVIFSGSVTVVQALVGIVTSQSVIQLENDVRFRQGYSGSILSVENTISALYSGNICKLAQRAIDRVTPSFFKRNGWDVNILIGSREITASELSGNLIITKQEDNSNICEFEVLVTDPVTFIDNVYDGSKQVVIDYFDGTNITRMITALVDSPEIDLINKRVKIKCSNIHEELVNDLMAHDVKTVGRYSVPVQGEFTSVKSELDLRLKSTPTSVNFDGSNLVNITPWAAKDTADYTLTDNNIFYRNPSIDWQNRGDIINNVEVDLTYKRSRLYHVERAFSWAAPYVGDPTDYAYNLYTSPTTEMVSTAIGGAGWLQVGAITYQQVYPLILNWFGLPSSVNVSPQLDEVGGVVRDSSGGVLYAQVSRADRPLVNVMSASWSASKQFSQFLQEHYTLTVKSPQSIAKNGTVTSYNNYTYEDVYDASGWESATKNLAVPSGATVSGANYYVDINELSAGTLNTAIVTALDIARTDILRTHRGTRITFETQVIPGLEIRHTMELDTALIACKGKIVKIQHTLDMIEGAATTQVVIALYRVPGAATETPRLAPARPTYSPTITGSNVVLGNHYGLVPEDTAGSDAWNGFIGNKATRFNSGFFNTPYISRTAFTDIFRVDTPAIPDTLRSLKDLPVSATYDIIVPNDDLDVDLTW